MKRLIVGVVALAGLLGACSPDKADYRDAAEKFIRDQLGEGATAVCQDPAATKVGTGFTCTGTASGGEMTQWNATITKQDKVEVGEVTDTGTPTDSAPAATTVPAATDDGE